MDTPDDWSTRPRDVAPERMPTIMDVAPVLAELGVREDETYVVTWDYMGSDIPAWEVRGDYGNHLKYGVRWIEFERLYEALVEIGKAEPRGQSPSP